MCKNVFFIDKNDILECIVCIYFKINFKLIKCLFKFIINVFFNPDVK